MSTKIFLTFLLTTFCLAQSPLNQDDPKPPQFSYCQYNGQFYYGIIPELYTKHELVFAIARLGDGETNRIINQVRLRQLKSSIEGSGAGSIPIVLAQGDRIKGEGGIEVYHGGKMIFYLRARQGCYFDFKCCDCNFRTPILKKGKINPMQQCP